jgi:hypothetical protein
LTPRNARNAFEFTNPALRLLRQASAKFSQSEANLHSRLTSVRLRGE